MQVLANTTAMPSNMTAALASAKSAINKLGADFAAINTYNLRTMGPIIFGADFRNLLDQAALLIKQSFDTVNAMG